MGYNISFGHVAGIKIHEEDSLFHANFIPEPGETPEELSWYGGELSKRAPTYTSWNGALQSLDDESMFEIWRELHERKYPGIFRVKYFAEYLDDWEASAKRLPPEDNIWRVRVLWFIYWARFVLEKYGDSAALEIG